MQHICIFFSNIYKNRHSFNYFPYYRDVSNNDLSLLPHGEPTGNVSLMAALGKNLKRIELHGNQITAIEDNTFLLNPNVEEL